MTSYRNCDAIDILTIYGRFGATEYQIPNAWSVKPTNSLIVNFYLTKTENKTENFPTQLSQYFLEQRYYF